jgi:hypothetical protein
MVPSGRVIVLSRDWLTPLPAWGWPVTMSGGHAAAQAPAHVDVPCISAWNRYTVRPLLPTRALAGIPEMVASDSVAAPLAWPVAAELLACVVAGAAAALEEAGLEAAGLEVVVLEPLEQAAISSPIPAAPMALAILRLTVRLPLRTPSGSARGPLHRVPSPGRMDVLSYSSLRAGPGSGSEAAHTAGNSSSYAGLIITGWPSLIPTEPRNRTRAPHTMPGMCERP